MILKVRKKREQYNFPEEKNACCISIDPEVFQSNYKQKLETGFKTPRECLSNI